MNTLRVLPSRPATCDVCGGDRAVELRGPGERDEYAIVPCLCCEWGLPVVALPMRGDR